MTRPSPRGILIILAVALNGWPWLDRNDPEGAFIAPSRIESTAATPVFHEEFINPDSAQAMSHVASIAELPDGRLVAAWYAGSREGASDVAIYFSTRGDRQWSPARAIVTKESATRDLNRYIKKVGNPLLFADPAGRLWLIYVTVSLGGWSGSSLNLTLSADAGVTWRVSRRLTLSPFLNLSELVKNAPVALSNGSWAVPIYHELIGTFPEVLWLNESSGDIFATKSRMSAGWYGYQPALMRLNRNRALAFLRADGGEKAVSVARSEDAGRSWAPPEPVDLPNPDSGLDAIRLMDGRLLLAFNDSTTGRENLRLALSNDEGQTWMRVATIAEEPGADFSYPFLLQATNGDVHLVYTWKRTAIRHVLFNMPWLNGWRRGPLR